MKRYCDCSRRHEVMVAGRRAPAFHEHANDMCSKLILGIGGCPGDGACEAWIEGAYKAGALLRDITSKQ